MRVRTLALAFVFLPIATTLATELTPAQRTLFDGLSAHRRVALAYLRTGNTDLAAVEIELLIERWRANLPGLGPIERSFQRSLAEAEENLEGSLSALEKNNLDQARALLERATAPLKEWRDSVGIRLFSDCITELSQAYGRLDVYRVRVPDLGNASTRDAVLTASLGTEGTVMRCDEEATSQTRTHPEFRRLIDGMLNSLRQTPEALLQRDGNYLHRLLIEQRSFEQLLAFRFG
jgi:hypothetical protein